MPIGTTLGGVNSRCAALNSIRVHTFPVFQRTWHNSAGRGLCQIGRSEGWITQDYCSYLSHYKRVCRSVNFWPDWDCCIAWKPQATKRRRSLQCPWEACRRWQGDTDSKLTETGRDQVLQVAEKFRAGNYDLILYSLHYIFRFTANCCCFLCIHRSGIHITRWSN